MHPRWRSCTRESLETSITGTEEPEDLDAALYPVFLDLRDRLCVVVGGGKVGGRKARGLVQAGATVKVISPDVEPGLKELVSETEYRRYETGDLRGAVLAFAATDSREANAAVSREAKESGIPVNVADNPSEGDFALPSTLRRGNLQVAVSTGGASPTLARQIRQELEGMFGPEWAGVVEQLEAARREGRETDEELERTVRRCLSLLSG